MASRYAETSHVDYCFHPLHVVKDGRDIIVPCGKCDGCLLHAANEWSMRCGMEIEGSPATIFFSFGYTNKYLPKLYPMRSPSDGSIVGWFSDHPDNVRFDSVKDVQRSDGIVIDYPYHPLDVTNWDNVGSPVIPYCSKRDIQLYLKLLRKDLIDEGFEVKDKKRGLIRYFIISEVGPTTHRPHGHGLLFCASKEISSYLLEGSLYKNWQMCLSDRFEPYAHLCDSGARGYVTQYITSFSDLPRVFVENKEVRPFRLSSKSPAVGYIEQDEKEVFESVSRGVIKYSRAVPRLESSSLLVYPKNFCASLFPKCFEFDKMADSRRYSVYSYLFRQVRECGYDYKLLRFGLSKVLHASDFLATDRCYRYCIEYGSHPMYYYYLLDMYYYQVDMENLRLFYRNQQSVDFIKTPERIFEFYTNIEVFCLDEKKLDYYRYKSLFETLSPLGYNIFDLIGNRDFFVGVHDRLFEFNSDYRKEVEDIKVNMIKMSKFNEATNNAPI